VTALSRLVMDVSCDVAEALARAAGGGKKKSDR
jgi:hypothetical protein